MTKDEINKFLKDSKRFETIREDYDSSTNHEVSEIRVLDGKYYLISLQNGHPYEYYVEGKGYIRGEYADPVEVSPPKTRMVEETYFTHLDSGEEVY